MIRPMKEIDIDSIVAIENKTFSTPWSKEAFLQELHSERAHYVVFELKEQVVGYGGFWQILDEGHITNLAISSEYRGQGLGKKLVEGLLNYCRSLNINSVTLEVRESNERAIHVYKCYGFREEGLRKNYYHDPQEDALILWSQLDN